MMNNSTGVRLVKCPKCYKLLPEPNMPVYMCGGCNTILRAKLRKTSGETSTTESNQNISVDLSEKDSYNVPPNVSGSESSVLNNNSERTVEHKILNSTQAQMRSTEKFDSSESEKTEILTHENLNLNSTPNVRLKEELEVGVSKDEYVEVGASKEDHVEVGASEEEHVEVGANKEEEPLKENHVPSAIRRAVLDLIDRSTKNEVQKKKESTSTSSEDFHSALNFMGLESEKMVRRAPKDAAAAAYRRPPKSSHSYEVLQADILSKVDKLRKELVELFGKAPNKMAISHLLQAERESSRYRRVRITPQENMTKAHQHHYMVNSTSSPLHQFQNTQAHKHGKRQQLIRRNHCLPILVGAPFVICSNCFQLIQLPTDFNVSSKKLRKLQCGKCSTILLYSYRPQPYHSKDTTPLTSSDSEMGTTPYTDPYPRGDPVSISEEYGMSFGISYSTDPEPGPPLHVSRNSSYSTMDGRSGRQTFGSRLHQIMGYESASEILLRQSSEISVRNDEISERERKGKFIVNENSEIRSSQGRLKRYGPGSPKRSGIQGFIKKGIIKLKP